MSQPTVITHPLLLPGHHAPKTASHLLYAQHTSDTYNLTSSQLYQWYCRITYLFHLALLFLVWSLWMAHNQCLMLEMQWKHSILRTKLKMHTIRTILFVLLVLTYSIRPRDFTPFLTDFLGASFWECRLFERGAVTTVTICVTKM